MYIDANTIIKAASLLSALCALIAAIIAVYKQIESNKKQSEIIKDMQDEQTLICKVLKCVSKGLLEIGCDGPVKEGLEMLDEHLNKNAHKPDL